MDIVLILLVIAIIIVGLFFKDFKYSIKQSSLCSNILERKNFFKYIYDYIFYLKYRLLKNFVLGKTKQRYKEKQIIYKKNH